jgi:aspartate 1-decarboxylase
VFVNERIFFSRLKIFKLQAQIICNSMQMSNDEVQEYQVEFIDFEEKNQF